MGAVTAPAAVQVVPPAGPIDAVLAAPASKSVTNRLLVVAALADGDSVLRGPLDSDDSTVMRAAVVALGAKVDIDAGDWRVGGTGGRLHAPPEPVDAGLSGTTLRFVTAVACLADGAVTVTGLPPLRRRPVGPLTEALRTLGADARDHGGYPPVLLGGGGLAGGEVTIDVTASSQFASALLLVAPYAGDDVVVRRRGATAADYITMTATTMAAWGGEVDSVEGGWRVRSTRGYEPRDVTVEYDASAAAHLFAVAAATGGTVTVTNAEPATHQPDALLPRVLASMGARVRLDGSAVTVTGPAQLAPVDVDLSAMPDQVTTVAALAALADGTSTIRGVGVARGHETDRLAALATELGRLGVAVDEEPDGLVVHGGTVASEPARPVRLETHDDHRLAMAFAALGARAPGLVIADPGCVRKTYPGFWEDLRRLGVDWHDVDGG